METIQEIRRQREWSKKSNKHLIKVPRREERKNRREVTFEANNIDSLLRNGNPLQYSCLENPRDGGAWWAAVYGVAQSRTRLKRLSSSSSNMKV